MSAIPSWFEDATYLANKAAQLNYIKFQEKTDWTASDVQSALTSLGITPYEHFTNYGDSEGVSPSQYFVASQYVAAKAAAMGTDEKSVWNGLKLAGISAWDDYVSNQDYVVNPSNAFSVQDYLKEKADALNMAQYEGRTDWTADEVLDSINAMGITVLEHYTSFGADEGLDVVPSSEPVHPTYNDWGDPDIPVPTEGESFSLTSALDLFDDGQHSTAGDDTYYGTEFDGTNTLQSGDRVDGGAGTDTMIADVTAGSTFGHDLNAVTPILNNVEHVKFSSRMSTDANTDKEPGHFTYYDNQSIAVVDAERISGMNELWNGDHTTHSSSRADLTVEDVRIASTALTVGWQDGESFNAVAGDYIDYKVFFNNQYIKAEGASTKGILNLQVMDIRNAIDKGKYLEQNTYNIVKFTYNDELVTLTIEDRSQYQGDATYQDLLEGIQAAISKSAYAGRIVATKGDPFTVYDTDGSGRSATGDRIKISVVDSGVLDDDPKDGCGWFAENGVDPDSDLHTRMTTDNPTTCPLKQTNIALDNVGMVEWNNITTCVPDNQIFGDSAGDMVVGGTGNNSYVGIERFDVKVDGGSWLASLSSTNNALRYVVVTNEDLNGDGVVGTTEAQTYTGTELVSNAADLGNLFIGLGDRIGHNSSTGDTNESLTEFYLYDVRPAGNANLTQTYRDGLLQFGYTETTLEAYEGVGAGLRDVMDFDASAMTGKANIAAVFTSQFSDKYLAAADQAKGLNLADQTKAQLSYAPDPDADGVMDYKFGSNDDTLNMVINPYVAADNDFNYAAYMNAGDDSVKIKFGYVNGDATLTNNGPNWYLDQWALTHERTNSQVEQTKVSKGNVTVNGGDNNDIINAWGTGNFVLNGDEGLDKIYSDNSGNKAVFVLNATRTITDLDEPTYKPYNDYSLAIKITDEGIAPLNNDVLSQSEVFKLSCENSSALNLTVRVTYKGVHGYNTINIPTSNITKSDGEYATTIDDITLNKMIVDAVSGNDMLNGLITIKEGAGHSLLAISKVDGAHTINDLDITFSLKQGSKSLDIKDHSSSTRTGETINEWYNDTHKEFARIQNDQLLKASLDGESEDGSETEAIENTNDSNGSFNPVSGVNSDAFADNIINGGSGNDLIVLGTGSYSNDTVVLNDSNNGNDFIVNFNMSFQDYYGVDVKLDTIHDNFLKHDHTLMQGRDYINVTNVLGKDPGYVDHFTALDDAGLKSLSGSSNNDIHYNCVFLEAKISTASTLQSQLNDGKHGTAKYNNTLFFVHDENGGDATFDMYIASFNASGSATVNGVGTVTFTDFVSAVDNSIHNGVDAFLKSIDEMIKEGDDRGIATYRNGEQLAIFERDVVVDNIGVDTSGDDVAV